MNIKTVAYFALEGSVLIVIIVFWQIKDWFFLHKKNGFFCGDTSISYPAQPASIPTEWLTISVYVAAALIWIIELFVVVLEEQKEIKKHIVTTTLRCLKWFIYYHTIFMLLMIIVALLKNLVGSLRPIFLQLCLPDTAVNCSVGQYIKPDYECTNPNASEFTLSEIRRSFPSGHAAASVYITFYFMRYLEARFDKYRITLSAVQSICFIWVVVCCVSRVTEHYHHVGDVLGGIVLALLFVYYSAQTLCNGFRRTNRKVEVQHNCQVAGNSNERFI